MFPIVLYLDKGVGLPGSGQSNSKVSKAVDGQKGDFGIWGSGMSRMCSQKWITIDQLTVKTSPLGLNCARRLHNDAWLGQNWLASWIS